MKKSQAEVIREYGPFENAPRVNGVTFDGRHVWFASGEKLHALDPESGAQVRSIDVASHAGTAFDGRYLYQIAEDRIHKIDPESGKVLSTIPAPGNGADSGKGDHDEPRRRSPVHRERAPGDASCPFRGRATAL